jgi:hypothetical protein
MFRITASLQRCRKLFEIRLATCAIGFKCQGPASRQHGSGGSSSGSGPRGVRTVQTSAHGPNDPDTPEAWLPSRTSSGSGISSATCGIRKVHGLTCFSDSHVKQAKPLGQGIADAAKRISDVRDRKFLPGPNLSNQCAANVPQVSSRFGGLAANQRLPA